MPDPFGFVVETGTERLAGFAVPMPSSSGEDENLARSDDPAQANLRHATEDRVVRCHGDEIEGGSADRTRRKEEGCAERRRRFERVWGKPVLCLKTNEETSAMVIAHPVGHADPLERPGNPRLALGRSHAEAKGQGKLHAR